MDEFRKSMSQWHPLPYLNLLQIITSNWRFGYFSDIHGNSGSYSAYHSAGNESSDVQYFYGRGDNGHHPRQDERNGQKGDRVLPSDKIGAVAGRQRADDSAEGDDGSDPRALFLGDEGPLLRVRRVL